LLVVRKLTKNTDGWIVAGAVGIVCPERKELAALKSTMRIIAIVEMGPNLGQIVV
jgi:hypothetical protein